MATSPRPPLGARLLKAFRNLVLVALFVGLAGAAFYGLSVLNSRTYGLDIQRGHVVVMKGRMLPVGMEPYTPAEPSLAAAYAPLDVMGNTQLEVVGKTFDERDQLDQALFSVIELIARPRLSSDVPRDTEVAVALVRRAEKLKGLTDAQRATLAGMRSDVAFFLAQKRLDEARAQLEEALEQLKLAAASESRHSKEASLFLLAVEPQVQLLSQTLRTTATMSRTMATPEGMKSLSTALEPQLKAVFEALQRRVDTPGATPEPAAGKDAPPPPPEGPAADEPVAP